MSKTQVRWMLLVVIFTLAMVSVVRAQLNCSGGPLNCPGTPTGTGVAVLQTSPTLVTPTIGSAIFTALIGGATPATAGLIRMSNNAFIYTRNAANTDDILTLGLASDNNVYTGGNSVGFLPNGTNQPLGSLTSPWGTVVAATYNATSGFQVNGVAVASPVICSNTAASSTITGTASKTYFSLNCAIAANTLTAGKTIGIDAQGVYNGNATDTIVLTVEFCKVSGCGSGVVVQAGTSASATLLAVSNDYWGVQTNTNIFTAGASGTVDTQGQAGFQTASTTIVPGVIANTGTTALDTTVIQYLSLSAKFSTNSGSDSITLRNLKVVIQ